MFRSIIAMVASILLAVLIVNTFILGDTNTIESESKRLGNNMVVNMKEVNKANTVTVAD